MTHDELLAEIDESLDFFVCGALRAVVEYAEKLSRTDYRGNPPVEHSIAKKLYEIIEKELNLG